MASQPPTVLFHYPGSPFAARVLYYLALRGIPYDECIQPNILPRPDLARLGIRYRRIPLLAIGRDVYLDTPLILNRLERFDPSSTTKPPFKSTATPSQHTLTTLLASYTLDTPLFKNVVCVLLPSTPLIHDEAFLKDRAEMLGGPPGFNFAEHFVLPARNDAIVEVKKTLEFLEFTLLADGRQWVAETQDPSLADIELVWPLHWLFSIPGAVPKEHITAEKFPKVYSWVERFEKAVGEARKGLRRPQTVSGEKVAAWLGKAGVEDQDEARVEQNDPVVKAQGLYQGQEVLLWPADTGANHKTKGKLVGFTSREITLDTTEGEVSVRVHAPRHGFRVAAVPVKAHLS
uniref:Putative glutathione S-transferase n=1 Tax=Aspergillus versicolor TaxID=46472 RepID=A0A3S5X8K0_ASPVE|nr:putative glutathione S-transferase [Aspergillus versicolor]